MNHDGILHTVILRTGAKVNIPLGRDLFILHNSEIETFLYSFQSFDALLSYFRALSSIECNFKKHRTSERQFDLTEIVQQQCAFTFNGANDSYDTLFLEKFTFEVLMY